MLELLLMENFAQIQTSAASSEKLSLECPQSAGVPRLYDLVRPSSEPMRLAFFYALRDTLVASDLDQASRIAYGRDTRWRRLVTLKVYSAALYQIGFSWL